MWSENQGSSEMLLQKKISSIALTNRKKRMELYMVRGGEYNEGEHSTVE